MVNLTETYRYGFIFTAGKVCSGERAYEDFALLAAGVYGLTMWLTNKDRL